MRMSDHANARSLATHALNALGLALAFRAQLLSSSWVDFTASLGKAELMAKLFLRLCIYSNGSLMQIVRRQSMAGGL
ncbi:hypothetical protein PVAP13_4NG149684 [Panicum virgatum]|uniref:Uncharacterized protein n=1 Tax=Panicum virgatum TaxID=38727 RepID=A0A8T0T8W4_PANVG|nr:hypothetical protein PVAP13_4NG149684 [Panicum virgatum]